MNIVVIIIAVVSLVSAIWTFILIRKKANYFKSIVKVEHVQYQAITVPYRAARKFFFIYSIALILGSICFYEIFKQYILH